MNRSKGRGPADFSKRYHQRSMWENITLEIWELLDWEALIPTIPSVVGHQEVWWTLIGAYLAGRVSRHDMEVMLLSEAQLFWNIWGDEIGYRVLGDHKRKKKKKEEERQNEKRRPALMQRRGSAGYYEFFRNLKDSSKAWLSVHTRVCECVCWGAGVHVRATLWSVSRLREGPSVGMIYY